MSAQNINKRKVIKHDESFRDLVFIAYCTSQARAQANVVRLIMHHQNAFDNNMINNT